MASIHKQDSAAIRVARVLCIFFMMSVHLVPGPSNASFITQGDGAIIGLVWLNFLGRASVATLSLVSGFLLVGAIEKYRPAQILKDRTRVLLAPMIAWNLIMLIAILGASAIGSPISRQIPSAVPFEMINAITGLFGPSLNLSLFFLRDLFVSSMLLVLSWRYIRRHLWVALAGVFVLTVFELTAPVIFRPTILLFMLAGCMLRAKHIHLSNLAAPQTLACGLLCGAAVFLSCSAISVHHGPCAEIQGVAKRAMLVFGIITVAVAIGRNKSFQAFFDRLEPITFLAYLSHALFAKLIWIGMSAIGIKLMGPSYVIYFVTAPMIVFALSLPMRRLIDTLPAPLPILLKGKSEVKTKEPCTTIGSPRPST